MVAEKFFNIRSRESDPFISITSYGSCSFSAAAFREFHIEEHPSCFLFWDEDEKKIIVELLTSKEPGSFRIYSRKSCPNGQIQARNFFRHFQNAPHDLTRYKIEKGPADNVLIINMASGVKRTNKPRKIKKTR